MTMVYKPKDFYDDTSFTVDECRKNINVLLRKKVSLVIYPPIEFYDIAGWIDFRCDLEFYSFNLTKRGIYETHI